MSRYWVISPAASKPSDVFDKVWDFDLANNMISIGWHELGDIEGMTRDEVIAAIKSTAFDKPIRAAGLIANMLLSFHREIQQGDYIIARRGRKTLAGVGRVLARAEYAPKRNPHIRHSRFLRVKWQTEPRDRPVAGMFPVQTLAEISEEQFQSLTEGSGLF